MRLAVGVCSPKELSSRTEEDRREDCGQLERTSILLSIAVVGGLLKNMDGTRASWESIRDNLSSVVNMDNEKHCLRLLKLSYNNLPVYLKPCFLHMGVFEEDKEIRVSMLVNLWISEGFLKPKDGEALETTARGFLHDLIDRNLILIHKLGCTGSIKSCKIHDLVRDMCLKEGFYDVIGQCNPPSPSPCQGMNSTQRRVVIPKNSSKENVSGDLEFLNLYVSHVENNNKLTFPYSLKKLTLIMESEFEWDNLMLEKIGSLPLLEKLRLWNGCFGKEKWETVEGQFPCLKYLQLSCCSGLENWTAAEEGSNILLRLQHLCLFGLDDLKEIPCELGSIDTLRRIQLSMCGEGAVKCAKEMVDEQLDSRGQLSFHVHVQLKKENQQHLLNLIKNFQVRG